jgi:regulator of replication initiation timing
VDNPHVRGEAGPAERPLANDVRVEDEGIIAKVYALFEAEIEGVKYEANLLKATVTGLDERVSRLEEENVVLRASNEELQRELASGPEITRSQNGQKQ